MKRVTACLSVAVARFAAGGERFVDDKLDGGRHEKHLSLWSGAAFLAVLDAVLCIQIVAFIGYSGDARCGSARMWVESKIDWIALAGVPIALWVGRLYFLARREMNPPALFVARLPLICLVALLLTYFAVLHFIP